MKKWTRADYAKMINLRSGRKRGRKTKKRYGAGVSGGGSRGMVGGLTEPLMLSRMIGRSNRNARQRNAIIDTMSPAQMRGIGRLFHRFLVSKYRLPRSRINQLIRDEDFVQAIVQGRGALDTRKKILKQKGGIFGALLPLAAKILAPTVLGSIAGKIFK